MKMGKMEKVPRINAESLYEYLDLIRVILDLDIPRFEDYNKMSDDERKSIMREIIINKLE